MVIKTGIKAISSIGKAGKTKNALDILKAVQETAKVVSKVAKKKAQKADY
jgi:hypothetical protein